MTDTQYIGTATRHTGDINLAAAMMACGIPLDPTEPVAIVEHPRGRYGSFYLCEYSDDGTQDADSLMAFWSGYGTLAADHGFSKICDFLKARPRGVHQTADVLDFAVDYLRERGFQLFGMRKLEDIPPMVNALPEGEASYILAYVWNRETCFRLYRVASRKVYYESDAGRDARRAILDARLPRWQAKEILSRLQG